MAESTLSVTQGSGLMLQTWSKTVGANTVHDQFVLPGEYPYATYWIQASNISIATANDHVLQIMAGASLNVRIRSITIEQNANATTAARATFELIRLSTAGTGGTAVTPAKADTADSAAGATGMTLPSAKGTETTSLRQTVLIMRQAISATQTQPEENILWTPSPNAKPIIIAAGTSNGIAIKSLNATAACTVNVTVEIVETSFV